MATTLLERPEIREAFTPRLTRYIPHEPTAKQQAFLLLPQLEAFYGGSAGGGKSDALLMAALQYVDVPGYAALLLRRTFADLSKPGALIPRSQEWLGGMDARWNEQAKQWRFPGGASVSFGYLEHEADKYQYQSTEYQFIGWDELTQFLETQYRYLFSRLRRLKGSDIPLRMRGASNPGNIGHGWVKQRFIIEGRSAGRPFIRASLTDNPYLDQSEYIRSLENLDPLERARLLVGDWDAQASGKFRRAWFQIVDEAPADCRWVRFWDMAATEVRKGQDPDWTSGAKVGLKDGVWYIGDIKRMRGTPGSVEALVKQTAELDGKRVMVRMEQEPGASGVIAIDHYARRVLVGFTFLGVRSTGEKEVRANPVASAAQAGNVKLVRGPWISSFLDEIEEFPNGSHDDQVDSVSGGFSQLTEHTKRSENVDTLGLASRREPNPLGLDLSNPKYRDRE